MVAAIVWALRATTLSANKQRLGNNMTKKQIEALIKSNEARLAALNSRTPSKVEAARKAILAEKDAASGNYWGK